MTAILEDHHGDYTGTGTWRDATGAQHRYQVTLTLAPRGDGLGLTFRHVFHEEEEQPDVALDLTLAPTAPGLLGFDLGGLAGRGYWDETTAVLAYHIPLPGNLVEATYVFADGSARVAGSSEKNAAGHFIMWTETLQRA